MSRRRDDARTQIDLIGAASIVTGLKPASDNWADPASLKPCLPGRAATLGDRPLPAGRKFRGMDALDHGPYSLHAGYRPCGGDSRLVPPPAGQLLALRSGLPAHAVSEVPDSIAGHPGRTARDGCRQAAGGHAWAFRRAYIQVCGNSAERRWNERIFGLRITPSRISIARPMVWSRSQAPGPSITVRRCGISASLISQVAEFHR